MQQLISQIPLAGEGLQVRVRSRRRAGQRFSRDEPAARAKEICNVAEGPYRVGLVHQEEPRIGQIERAAQRRGIQLVQVARDHFHVAQLKGGHDRSRPLDRRLAGIDADYSSGEADHLRQDREPAEGAAAAVDRVPPLLDTDPAERRAGRPRAELGDAQEPPEVLI
jgi:hypothetical protein